MYVGGTGLHSNANDEREHYTAAHYDNKIDDKGVPIMGKYYRVPFAVGHLGMDPTVHLILSFLSYLLKMNCGL